MGLDLSFFDPGANPLLDIELRGGVGLTHLWPAAALLAVLLGYCAYTDLWCGRVIRNSAGLCLALGATSVVPLAYAAPGRHLLGASVVIAVLFVLLMLGVFAEGDFKLFSALSIVFAEGTLVLILASFTVIILYSLPALVRTRRRRAADRKAGEEKAAKEYLTKMPAGPGIALAYPITLLLAGVDPVLCAGAAALVVATALLARGCSIVDRKVEAAEQAREQASADAPA